MECDDRIVLFTADLVTIPSGYFFLHNYMFSSHVWQLCRNCVLFSDTDTAYSKAILPFLNELFRFSFEVSFFFCAEFFFSTKIYQDSVGRCYLYEILLHFQGIKPAHWQ